MSSPSAGVKRPSPSAARGAETTVSHDRYVTSETLFRGRRELRIAHAGQEYRLSITRQGKLILTK